MLGEKKKRREKIRIERKGHERRRKKREGEREKRNDHSANKMESKVFSIRLLFTQPRNSFDMKMIAKPLMY